MTFKKGLYRHFKGNYYQVIDSAKDSETQELMVIYRALYGDKKLWLRPLEVFFEVIEREGVKKQRFAYCDEQTQVLEITIFDIVEGQETPFEQVFEQAQTIISSMPDYITHHLQRCIENQNRYILQVEWQKSEDHMVGLRESEEYQQWRELLHHFFSETPSVLHYQDMS